MRRKFGIKRSGKSHDFGGTDINPMDGLANLADVMMVFACGIMLALIINWNVDVGSVAAPADIDTSKEVTELSGLANDENADLSQTDGYESYGKVYKDKETGALYVVTDK